MRRTTKTYKPEHCAHLQTENSKLSQLQVKSLYIYMGVSKNRVTPKWMVYNGKPYENGRFGGTTIFGNTHIYKGSTYMSQCALRCMYFCTCLYGIPVLQHRCTSQGEGIATTEFLQRHRSRLDDSPIVKFAWRRIRRMVIQVLRDQPKIQGAKAGFYCCFSAYLSSCRKNVFLCI